MPRHFDFFGTTLSAAELFDGYVDTSETSALLDSAKLIGTWHTNLKTGLSYWTKEIFEIHGMAFRPGPVDLIAAMQCYSEDDRGRVADLFESTFRQRGAFEFVLPMHGHDRVARSAWVFGRHIGPATTEGDLIGIMCSITGTTRHSRFYDPILRRVSAQTSGEPA